MSTQDVLRFILAQEKNEEMRNDLARLLSKYEMGNPAEERRGKAVRKETPPAGANRSFGREDLQKIKKPAVPKTAEKEIKSKPGGSQFTTNQMKLGCRVAGEGEFCRHFLQSGNDCQHYSPNQELIEKHHPTYTKECGCCNYFKAPEGIVFII